MKLIDVPGKVIGKAKQLTRDEIEYKNNAYLSKYEKYAFTGDKCIDERQYEAVITRWYHTIEKGLAYIDFRAGCGKSNLNELLTAMENYIADGYSPDVFFFSTALSALKAYQDKNAENDYVDEELNARIAQLPGTPNEVGGTIVSEIISEEEVQKLGYADFIRSRHSMRHFSSEPLDKNKIDRVIELAQNTPSACNRQGWRARVILDKELMTKVLENQNGNKGFGHEFTGLILVTGDVRCFNKSRELYQVYIDGGMYAQSILNALHYENIASVPLSASLTSVQEDNVRKILNIEKPEVLIMFIGIGNYPEEGLTTRSERKRAYPIYF